MEPPLTGPALMARLLSQEPAVSLDTAEAIGNVCTAAARASEDTKCALMDSSYPDAALAVAGKPLASPPFWNPVHSAACHPDTGSVIRFDSCFVFLHLVFHTDSPGPAYARRGACQVPCSLLSDTSLLSWTSIAAAAP